MTKKQQQSYWKRKSKREYDQWSMLFLITIVAMVIKISGTDHSDFDYLIFSQRWLPSSCIEYMEKNDSSHHHCVLLDKYDFWAIHGLWPTKIHTIGPFFCNKSMKFDGNALEPIKSDLEKYWPNIEQGKGLMSLWRHEWVKHGTCAAILESLNSEIKYFNTTLELFNQYDLEKLFLDTGIKASDFEGISVTEVFNAVKNNFGKNPNIRCVTEVKSQQTYLSEIRLCFDSSLQLIDCEDINNEKLQDDKKKLGKTYTNCPLDSLIKYPANIDPAPSDKKSSTDYNNSVYDRLLEILYTLRFLQWAF